MRATTDLLIAVTGAPLHLTVGGRDCPQWEPVSVRAGETVALRGIDRRPPGLRRRPRLG